MSSETTSDLANGCHECKSYSVEVKSREGSPHLPLALHSRCEAGGFADRQGSCGGGLLAVVWPSSRLLSCEAQQPCDGLLRRFASHEAFESLLKVLAEQLQPGFKALLIHLSAIPENAESCFPQSHRTSGTQGPTPVLEHWQQECNKDAGCRTGAGGMPELAPTMKGMP